MMVDTILERVNPLDSRNTKLPRYRTRFLSLSESSVELWQELLGPLASLEWFSQHRRIWTHPLQCQSRPNWSCMDEDLNKPVFISGDCKKSIEWWLWDKALTAGVMHHLPSSYLQFTGVSQTGWGLHPQERTTAWE